MKPSGLPRRWTLTCRLESNSVLRLAPAAADTLVVSQGSPLSGSASARKSVQAGQRFYFVGGRPVPGLRIRSVSRSLMSASSSSRRRMVSTNRPVICARRVRRPSRSSWIEDGQSSALLLAKTTHQEVDRVVVSVFGGILPAPLGGTIATNGSRCRL